MGQYILAGNITGAGQQYLNKDLFYISLISLPIHTIWQPVCYQTHSVAVDPVSGRIASPSTVY